MYSNDDLQHDFHEALNIVAKYQSSVLNNMYTITLNNRYTKALGKCTRFRNNSEKFAIQINNTFAQSETREHIMNTITHEVIHCCKNSFCHTGRWLEIADMVNRDYGMNISRLTNTNNIPEYQKLKIANDRVRIKYEIVCDS